MADPPNPNSFLNSYMNMTHTLESGFAQTTHANSFLRDLPETLNDLVWSSNIAATSSNSVGSIATSLNLMNAKLADINTTISGIGSNMNTAVIDHIALVVNSAWLGDSCAFASNALTTLNNDGTALWASNTLGSTDTALVKLRDAHVCTSNDVSRLISIRHVTWACNTGSTAFYANTETSAALPSISEKCLFLRKTCEWVSNCIGKS